MLYEYFNSDDVFIKPGILMIDTPLLGFDENEDGTQGATLKTDCISILLIIKVTDK